LIGRRVEDHCPILQDDQVEQLRLIEIALERAA